MSDVKISELPNAQPLTGDELIPLVQTGETRKSPISAIVANKADLVEGKVPAAQLPERNNFGDANVAYVATNGDDATGRILSATDQNQPVKAFKTLQAAYQAATHHGTSVYMDTTAEFRMFASLPTSLLCATSNGEVFRSVPDDKGNPAGKQWGILPGTQANSSNAFHLVAYNNQGVWLSVAGGKLNLAVINDAGVVTKSTTSNQITSGNRLYCGLNGNTLRVCVVGDDWLKWFVMDLSVVGSYANNNWPIAVTTDSNLNIVWDDVYPVAVGYDKTCLNDAGNSSTNDTVNLVYAVNGERKNATLVPSDGLLAGDFGMYLQGGTGDKWWLNCFTGPNYDTFTVFADANGVSSNIPDGILYYHYDAGEYTGGYNNDWVRVLVRKSDGVAVSATSLGFDNGYRMGAAGGKYFDYTYDYLAFKADSGSPVEVFQQVIISLGLGDHTLDLSALDVPQTRLFTRINLAGAGTAATRVAFANVSGAVNADKSYVITSLPSNGITSITNAVLGVYVNQNTVTLNDCVDVNNNKIISGSLTFKGSSIKAPNQPVLPATGDLLITRNALVRQSLITPPPYVIPLASFSRVSSANYGVAANGGSIVYGQAETRNPPTSVSATSGDGVYSANPAAGKIPTAGEYAATYCRDQFFYGESGIRFVNSIWTVWGNFGATHPLMLSDNNPDNPNAETHGYLWYGGFDITTGTPVTGSKCYVVETMANGSSNQTNGYVRLGIYDGTTMRWSSYVKNARVATTYGVYLWQLVQDGDRAQLWFTSERYSKSAKLIDMSGSLSGVLQYTDNPGRVMGVGIRCISNEANSHFVGSFHLYGATFQPFQNL